MSLAGIVIHKEGMVKPQRFTILPLAVQGFGNVGSAVAIFFAQAGATIISVSDSQGGIYNENGIDLEEARAHKLEHGLLSGLHESTSITNQELLELDCEILIPATGHAGSLSVYGAGDHSVRVCDTHRQHADGGAMDHLRRSAALFSDHLTWRISGRG
jgi:hypothetical protein